MSLPIHAADCRNEPAPCANETNSREVMLTPAVESLRSQLVDWFTGRGRVAVALSGGVDSAVVTRAAFMSNSEQAFAITAISASLSSREQEMAEHVARLIGVRHVLMTTREFDNPEYSANPVNRCYFCKSELYGQIASQFAGQYDLIVNGTNRDDEGDYRPGLESAREHGVASPLSELGIGKEQVRQIALSWGLPCWNKPASPCLSSRIAYGVAVTPERVRRIEQAENWLRREFALTDLRVRLESGELARVEIPCQDMSLLMSNNNPARIVKEFLNLGFRCVTLDLGGLRSGSLNDLLTLDSALPKIN